MVRKPRQPPAPEPEPVPQEEPMPAPQAAPQAGNGQHAYASPRAIPADQASIITAQQALLTSQITMVRDIETQLSLSPGPPPAPGTGANIQLTIDNQGAAIRTQAAYIKHLQDTAAALGITLA